MHASHSSSLPSDTHFICQHLHCAFLPTTAILLWEDPVKGLSLGICLLIQSGAEETWQGMPVLMPSPLPSVRGQENWETFPRAKFSRSQGASRNHKSQFVFKVRQIWHSEHLKRKTETGVQNPGVIIFARRMNQALYGNVFLPSYWKAPNIWNAFFKKIENKILMKDYLNYS